MTEQLTLEELPKSCSICHELMKEYGEYFYPVEGGDLWCEACFKNEKLNELYSIVKAD